MAPNEPHQVSPLNPPVEPVAIPSTTPPGLPSQLPVTPTFVGAVDLPSSLSSAEPAQTDQPIAVVRVLSVRGVEYGMMSIVLWIVASTLAWLLLNLVNSSKTFDYLVVPTSALVVCVPIFGLLFIRLKRAELANPSLRLEPSKRRWSQLTIFIAFIVTVINLIVLVYQLLNNFGSDSKSTTSVGKILLDALVVLVIAGGILIYYWREEHRSPRG